MKETLRATLQAAYRSLRFRMVAAAAVVLAAMLTVLVANGVRLVDQSMRARELAHVATIEKLLGATLSGLVARRDRAAVAVLLDSLRDEAGLQYLVVEDALRRPVAAAGWADGPPPPRQPSLATISPEAPRFDGGLPLMVDGRVVGYVSYGLSLAALHGARSSMAYQGAAIGWIAFLLAVGALVGLGMWLGRDLKSLYLTVAAVKSGQADMPQPVIEVTEVADVATAFADVAQTLRERIEALAKSEARFHAIADYTYGVEAWFNPDGQLIWINRAIERVSGYTAIECLQADNPLRLLVHEPDAKFAEQLALRALRGREPWANFEVRFRRKDGAVTWVALNWQPIYGADETYLGLRVSVDEIHARKEAELKLLETVAELHRAQGLKEHYLNRANSERARLDALLNTLAIGVVIVDEGNRALYCNRAFRLIWGFAANENLTGVRYAVLVERTEAMRADDPDFRRRLQVNGDPVGAFEVPLVDGRILFVTSDLVPGSVAGRFIGRVWIFEDITERKRFADQLVHLATRDPLTNLFNRRRFHEELERMLADADRHSSIVGLLMLDLDGFKPINDRFGHQAGDRVLVQLAHDVGMAIRRNEMFFRLGGDEFAVLATDTDEEAMIGLARRISDRVAAMHFPFGNGDTAVSASIGIGLFPVNANTPEALIACADEAMYAAKAAGKGVWRLCDKICRL